MKNCPNCGTQNPDDAKFCESCGTALVDSVQRQPVSGSPQNVTATGKASTGLSILSFLIPLVGIILGITYMNDADPAKKAAGKTYLYLGIGGMILGCIIVAAGGGGGGY